MKLWNLVLVLLGVCVWFQVAAANDDAQDFDPGFDLESNAAASSDEFLTPKEILLVSWEPFPIDQWNFIVLNITGQFVSESGRIQITQFTKKNFPAVSLVFTCKGGDNAYFPNELGVPIIGVDTFQNDYYFQQYLSIIYTIHGFTNPTELWAHFFIYQDAFSPVRERVSVAFQDYVNNFKSEPLNDLTRPYPEDRRRS